MNGTIIMVIYYFMRVLFSILCTTVPIQLHEEEAPENVFQTTSTSIFDQSFVQTPNKDLKDRGHRYLLGLVRHTYILSQGSK